ncbi:ATP-dependent RNA helicase HrpA [Nonomuraea jiangxiensis]|uniref:RNA helicase n=1 Tax=Nonomuraea jiangxiensis TaxID=633440 RepID=A0A1G9U6S8_9ACTN|nr:ATP-dependent RNA helicase HrpA [Nonomuraea jiangxiensis]SDM55265.1 ATP-dependent helicase HrpA [Nonomuraea jiangxiensis]
MGTSSLSSPLTDLQSRLPELMPRDQRRLQRRLDGMRRVRSRDTRDKIVAEILADVERAEQRLRRRREAVPAVTYPENLPVSQRKDDILAAIRDHQVVIIAGETGSGKTTQIPKICLELGRGVRGLIGHTQPRRIAARTVAERIAEELGTGLGEVVGYKVRFTDQASDRTLVKVMTDGILLAELQHDRMLDQYDTLIIDEAHERSLNIDFILGYLKQLLPRRPDLKVVITSATIDPERFSRHFDDAPIIEVSGRTYPVEVRYRPLDEDDDQTQGIVDACRELIGEGPGDILVFLSGEREIRDAADALAKAEFRNTEILPLYARLSAPEQHRVFQRHTGRRIVLATNVAETSLTVPGIKYVVDPGFARISRYSHRTKVQRLPIEAISQASANQRKGRSGRTSDGICIRLYEEEDFLGRPEFTDPEILRTNLASVILQMTSIGLGDIEAFPFVEPPDRRQVKDGVNLLHELGAFDGQGTLTGVGRRLAGLPVDPRLGRMVLEAEKNGSLREVMVIAAALSIQDPRERPSDKQQQADEKHRRFADPESDFMAYLNLWNYLRDKQKELSSSAFRRLCKAEFLNYLRVREWQDIYSQLRQSLGVQPNSHPADPYHVHVSLLVGLLSHIGVKEVMEKRGADGRRPIQEYSGARNARFAIFPGSALAKKQPQWVMSAELVETSRLWARVNAKIEPDWVEPLAQHLVKRTYSEPHWEKNQGAVIALEKVTLYGVPLVTDRKVNYGRIDPDLSRELFIRHALVEGDWDTHHRFLKDNRRLLDEVEELENRARRRDILVDDEALYDFYDQRVPADVVSARHFDSWWKKARQEQPELLTFSPEMLVNEGAEVSTRDYPDTWKQLGQRMRLTYQFEPGTDADGVTVHVPLQVLNQVNSDGFDWQIPGLREELITALIRSLPKNLRRNFVPAPNYAKQVLAGVRQGGEPLLAAVERELLRLTGVRVPREAWQLDQVPDHLRITYRVIDERKRTIAEDKDLDALKRRLAPRLRQTLSQAGDDLEQSGLHTWSFGTLPKVFEQGRMKGYPALVDAGDSVSIKIFETEAEQRRSHWPGVRRLLLLNVTNPAKSLLGGLSNQAKLALSRSPHGGAVALFDDVVNAAVDKLMLDVGGPAWDPVAFDRLYQHVRANLHDTAKDVLGRVEQILSVWHDCGARLDTLRASASTDDVRDQLGKLVHPGFVTATGYRRLSDVLRYIRAIDRRLTKLPEEPWRDEEWMSRVHKVEDEYHDLLDKLHPARRGDPDVREIRWMIEELRVSFFAQTLGTPTPVSEKRIAKAMEKLTP